MDSLELAFAGVARQAELVREGEVSSRELVELCLERIERIDSTLNAFNIVMADEALEAADRASGRKADPVNEPLSGVPIAVKDNMDVAGQPTSHGSSGFEGIADADCEAVRRLREAGAIIIGKTNVPELSIYGFTETERFGITRNPWDTTRSPAGSSGGSGAAVAAGLVPGATANDGAGSIRWPAASNGLFGIKPQRGRVPLAPATDAWHGMSAHGFLTRSVADSALLLDVATAGGPLEAGGPPVPDRSFSQAARTPPGHLRIAWSMQSPRALAPPIVDDVGREAVAESVELLRSLGHETFEVNVDYGMVGNNCVARYLRGISDDSAEADRPEMFEKRTRQIIRLGRRIPNRELRRAMKAEQDDRERIGRVFERHDLLLTPMLATQPIEIGRWKGKGGLRTLIGMSRVYPVAIVWNHTGQPAASVPAGFDSDGLPRSVQLVSRPNDEATIISLATQMQAARDWTERRPDLANA